MPVSLQSEIYTVREAAAFLDLAVGTIRQYVTHGVLNPTRVGRAVMFTREELDRYQSERWPQGKHRPADD